MTPPSLLEEFVAFYLNILVVVLAVVAARRWAGVAWSRRTLIFAVVAVVAAFTWYAFGVITPEQIPLDWVTVLQEGRGAQNILQLRANGAHAGPNFALVGRLLAHESADLLDVVRLNLWLTAVDAVLLAVLAAVVARRWWFGLLAVAAYLASPAVLNAAVSEYPAPLLGFYVLVGVPAAWLVRHEERTRTDVVLGCLQFAALAVLSAMTRPETGFVGVAALLSSFPELLRQLGSFGNGLLSVGRRLTSPLRSYPVRVALVVLVTLAWQHLSFGLSGTQLWAFDGLHPANPTWITMFRVVPPLTIPLGILLLAVLSALVDLHRPGRAFGLGIAAIVLYRTYFSASHNAPFEQARYFTVLAPILLVAAAIGWRLLEEFTAATSRKTMLRGVALAGLVIGSVLAPLPSHPAIRFPQGDSRALRTGETSVPLARDQQREVRFLLRQLQAEPECLFVTRVTKQLHDDPPREWEYVYFGPDGYHAMTVAEPEGKTGPESLKAAVATLRRRPPCLRFYVGLDCNIANGDRCRDVVRGLALVEEEERPTLPYNDLSEYGPFGDTMRFAVYRIGD